MTVYEELLEEVDDNGLIVREKPLSSSNGRIYKNRIAISNKLRTTTEKACVLSEELGHHYTSVGCILDQADSQNRKQERQARLWAYNKQIGLRGLIRAYEHGCRSRHEIAEFLEVTEEFLQNAIDCYRDKYGIGAIMDNYYIMFIPNLQIMKLI